MMSQFFESRWVDKPGGDSRLKYTFGAVTGPRPLPPPKFDTVDRVGQLLATPDPHGVEEAVVRVRPGSG